MDQKDIKRRDVMDFDKFSNAYDQAHKTVMLKQGQNAHPGAHVIEAENLYVRNDANPYKAMGIPYDEKQADINPKYMNANQVDVFHDRKLTPEEKKTVTDAYGSQVVTHHQMAFILDESISDEIKWGKLAESVETNKHVFNKEEFERNLEVTESIEEKKKDDAEPKEDEPKEDEPKEDEPKEEEKSPEDAAKEKYEGKSVTLNGDHAKISDDGGVAKIESATNSMTMAWKEIEDVMSKKSGNFHVEKKEEPKEEEPKEEKKEKKAEKHKEEKKK